MKLIHLADLHIGKKVNEFSMIDDQEYILKKILAIIEDEKPDGLLIAGDIYDKSIPAIEAVKLLDDFLVALAKIKVKTFIISGNHDSAERISFASDFLTKGGIFISPAYNGQVKAINLEDQYGKLDIFMMPFIKPINVRKFFPEEEINTYTDAMRIAIDNMEINPKNRNILMAHQFVTGASRTDSEEISVGGLDNIDASVFDDFDYVALGHIHRPQNIQSQRIRYSGTPLKYSFSEANDQKSVTVLEFKEKGNMDLRTIDLIAKRDMRKIRGTYMELTNKKNYENTRTDDYIQAILTDENYIPNALARLRTIYPNLMKLEYDNLRTQKNRQIEITDKMDKKSPLDLLAQFYKTQNNQNMTEDQYRLSKTLIQEIWGKEL